MNTINQRQPRRRGTLSEHAAADLRSAAAHSDLREVAV